MRLAYVTNNAFRTPAAIAALLTSFGAPASPQDVVTSAQAACPAAGRTSPLRAALLVLVIRRELACGWRCASGLCPG